LGHDYRDRCASEFSRSRSGLRRRKRPCTMRRVTSDHELSCEELSCSITQGR
jgi:hypothetical protein